MTVFFAGGGTAGHLYAGIALADRIRERVPGADIRFVGARGGMEERLVPRAGYPLHLVEIGAWSGVSLARRLKTLLQVPVSCLRSLVWLLWYRPRVVLGVGGYASFPMVLIAGLTAWLWRGKVAILEQNVLPGLTNRILGRVCRHVFAAFPGAERVFGGRRVIVTGNPVRESIQPLSSATRNPFTVFVFGGSQGAMGINSLVIEALEHLHDADRQHGVRLAWIHQTGEKDFERVHGAHARWKTEGRVEKFLYDMPECYGRSSLLVCRAGASTLSEIATVGRAAILVPLVSKDRHQEFNARLFAGAGAAEILLQKQSSGADLAHLILSLAKDTARVEKMEQQVVQFARPDSVECILRTLLPEAFNGEAG